MSKKTFTERDEMGKYGEAFAYKYLPQLIHTNILVGEYSIGRLKYEGADILAYELVPLPSQKSPAEEITTTSSPSSESVATPLGFQTSIIEVKRINHFTSRDNDGRPACGSIPFELWNSPTRNPQPGSLFRMINPAAYEKSCKPSVLIYMLFETADDEVPYACVAVEDFGALEAQLRKLSSIDLDSWASIPFDRPRRHKQYGNMHLYQNMWYVPLDCISHLATVTMIRTGVLHCVDNRCPKEVQRNRLNFLRKLANGRRVHNFIWYKKAPPYNKNHALTMMLKVFSQPPSGD